MVMSTTVQAASRVPSLVKMARDQREIMRIEVSQRDLDRWREGQDEGTYYFVGLKEGEKQFRFSFG